MLARTKTVGLLGIEAYGIDVEVDVAVAGAQELCLIVEFGANGPVLGRADWADARLLR